MKTKDRVYWIENVFISLLTSNMFGKHGAENQLMPKASLQYIANYYSSGKVTKSLAEA